ncbi:NAD(P)-dependent oxidoreductase [Nocardia sp. BMG111209]|uniref:NAD(P)-dependent oxidoreductase n=1 Tax=Nocardia sp. BMG111209 TaxID=1160137 RepID=UPI0003A9D62D|nr:NAD(P)-binding domain-containing protein [Nocardia sp. BMG111209]
MTNIDPPSRRSVSVLGLGPMGRALATALLAAGHPTTVWNRTPGRADTLAAQGVRVAGTVDEAIHSTDLTIVCLRDYDAVVGLLGERDRGGRTLINLTSGEPAQARRLAESAGAQGITYLDGAILSPTPLIGTPAATVLYSGPPEAFAAVRGDVEVIGSAVYLGADIGRANAYDIALLDLFATAVHGVAHAFALASAEGIRARDLAPFATGIGGILPEMITRFADRIDAGEHPGERSTIASAHASVRHVIAAAKRHGIDTGALDAARAVIGRSIAAGHADAGLSRLAVTLRIPQPRG